MPIGKLVMCKSHNNGIPLFPWERWFKNISQFMFQKNVYYTFIEEEGKVFVINRKYEPIEFSIKEFKILFSLK